MTCTHIEDHGFALLPGIIDAQTCNQLITSLGPVTGAGRRGLLSEPGIAKLALSEALLNCVRPHLPSPPIAVRGIYFDKSAHANWLVPWHQDLTLALASKADHPAVGPWSVKEGVYHAQASASMLQQMITIRLHLDPTTVDDGPLIVLPGSHKLGLLTPDQITHCRNEHSQHICTANQGDVMLMRPLLLHASSKSTSGNHRRIIHIEYAGFDLPAPLRWHETAARL